MLAFIDVGSNSVRLLLNGKKTVINTRLSEKMLPGGNLLPEPMRRTAEAIFSLYSEAKTAGAETYVFATEAVRSAANRAEFEAILKNFGINLDVLDSETEAYIGFIGAYCGDGETQAVLDVGGASSELAVGNGDGIVYFHSLPVGSVRMSDYSDDPLSRLSYARNRVKEYGSVPMFSRLISIGGTSSSIVAIRDEVEPYDPNKIHGKVLTYADIERVLEKILSTPPHLRAEIKGLHPQKVNIIPAGCALFLAIMEYLNINEITVSECDNLEGYGEILASRKTNG